MAWWITSVCASPAIAPRKAAARFAGVRALESAAAGIKRRLQRHRGPVERDCGKPVTLGDQAFWQQSRRGNITHSRKE
jgi:hypothetical protein